LPSRASRRIELETLGSRSEGRQRPYPKFFVSAIAARKDAASVIHRTITPVGAAKPVDIPASESQPAA
jgi:hypothetical protein